MYAAIDIGSNTVRMLIGECKQNGLQPRLYQHQITRLAGGYQPEIGLARESIDRTLAVVSEFARIAADYGVEKIRAVGTAALRRAENGQHLVNLVKMKTRLPLEIISGDEEARLSATGVLSVLKPTPQTALIVDIGGGSTELVFQDWHEVVHSCSYPVGVVQLSEEMPHAESRRQHVKNLVVKFSTDMLRSGVSPLQLAGVQLIGTAGTFTTLAALDLKMSEYDRSRINNHQLNLDWLLATQDRLDGMSIAEREQLPGFEPGRGDVIMPGLEMIIALCQYLKQQSIRVADSGLLEGLLLDFCADRSD
ncbi:Ppx/GppA phosphatase [Malonomonas rubra DSM 5091]|uniref:Ppx/GppA phosphatase n=1 Tax=Malonomonas rubra DSM 5091 TaxID=1122189 RepID=A0A1M6B7N8_MALRU|nr:Ppx/GppA phosphatase family protein [Malonomonas rubra]SHI44751.1 Ppx/GppA phosphatase [Malonomonas rubra DSM 5091]